MSEETQDVIEEVVQPQEEDAQRPDEDREESDKDYNFRALRDKQRQIDEENRQLREYIASLQNQPKETEAELGDDDIADGRALRKLEKKIEQMLAQQQAQSAPDRVRSRFQDFSDVVNADTTEVLRKTEPELYATLDAEVRKDPYSGLVATYKVLKKLKPSEAEDNRARVKENSAKPLSAQAIKSQGALAEANAFTKGPLTKELQQSLLREMREATKAS
jgi:hypothetical protein